MSRATVLSLLALGLVLGGCPLPQALPEYSAGTNTPPRILVDEQLAPRNGDFDGAITLIPANCVTTAPTRVLTARIVDTNTVESVEARWFVNYDFRDSTLSEVQNHTPNPIIIAPNGNSTDLVRAVPSWTFEPYRYPPPYGTPSLNGPPYRDPGVLRVVELVVSNGFDPSALGTLPAANRAPRSGFETQAYRWVFLTVPESSSVPCPP